MAALLSSRQQLFAQLLSFTVLYVGSVVIGLTPHVASHFVRSALIIEFPSSFLQSFTHLPPAWMRKLGVNAFGSQAATHVLFWQSMSEESLDAHEETQEVLSTDLQVTFTTHAATQTGGEADLSMKEFEFSVLQLLTHLSLRTVAQVSTPPDCGQVIAQAVASQLRRDVGTWFLQFVTHRYRFGTVMVSMQVYVLGVPAGEQESTHLDTRTSPQRRKSSV
ncbi:Hypothetical_protein [Hexamita inflata]|uniref:Hypothetical_protein n=1 Tax=Hexamita inflata TaxID=28002 RepID=A0AA86PDL1_9EUKA|nr:Hypothetical protein HINF_LOCUS24740 [Hexamita inflata]